jgi:hypothetical protein
MSRRTLIILVAILVIVFAILAMLAVPPAGAQTPTPTRLAVRAIYAGDGVRVTWPPVPWAVLTCVLRPGGVEPYGCAQEPGRWRQARTSLDVGLAIRPGQRVEVRAYDMRGELMAQGQAIVRWAVFLPGVRR